MAVLTITAVGLGPQLIAGIPQLVELVTNLPATVFFTLDGSEPNVSSPVYVYAIELPTATRIRLRALAVSGPDTGTLDITFSALPGIVHPTRRFDGYGGGIIIDGYGVPEVVVDGYGPDTTREITDGTYPVDLPVRGSDIPLADLDIKYSRTNEEGDGTGTLIAIGFPSDLGQRESAVDPRASSPNHNNVYFNPRSQFIVIDGRDGYADQSVFIINRPMGGTMDDTKYLGGKAVYEPAPYISGALARHFYNYEKGIAVFYYFDHNECRWIKSIQKIQEPPLPDGVGMRRGTGVPLVFKWVYGKRSMI
jgi:hypothetical protein